MVSRISRCFGVRGGKQLLNAGIQRLPFMLRFSSENSSPSIADRSLWKTNRFGNLQHTIFGNLQDAPESGLKFPFDFEQEVVTSQGNKLLFKFIDVHDSKHGAERIAEIYQNGIDELKGNSFYDWHHDPQKIIEFVEDGDMAFFGCWDMDSKDMPLISVNSLLFIRGQRTVDWIWGVVDPQYRGNHVWECLGQVMDQVISLTNTQFAMAWLATTHNLSQKMIESIDGWQPMGVFPGGEFLAGSDGKYYRQTVMWYGKLYGNGKTYTQSHKDMVLTEKAKRVVDVVFNQ